MTDKNPVKVRAGQIGAEKRWKDHAPAVWKIADLTDDQRKHVKTMIDTFRAANAVTSNDRK